MLELRGNADALLVGRRTLIADHMTLTCPGKVSQPLRCIVAKNDDIPESLPLFERPGGAIHWLITGAARSEPSRPDITMHCGTLENFLTTLGTEHGVKHIHCEGGGTLIRLLGAMDAIDELHLTLAGHTLFGGFGAPTATGPPAAYLPSSLAFRISEFTVVPGCGECFVSYRRRTQ